MNAFTHSTIDTSRQFLETLKGGPYTWPGAYPLYFITNDGAALSFNAARENVMTICRAIRQKSRCGWRIIACNANWEDGALYCDHTNERIESAYAENEVAT